MSRWVATVCSGKLRTTLGPHLVTSGMNAAGFTVEVLSVMVAGRSTFFLPNSRSAFSFIVASKACLRAGSES